MASQHGYLPRREDVLRPRPLRSRATSWRPRVRCNHGRVLRRPRPRSFGRVKGLVAGAYTELSPDFQILVNEIAEHVIGGPLGAEANLRTGANALGRPRIRRRLGVSAARSHADLVLAGLQFCGPGGAEAYARRNRTGGRNHCMHQSMMAERNCALQRFFHTCS